VLLRLNDMQGITQRDNNKGRTINNERKKGRKET
jgi:hypothetical protein